MEQAWRAVRDVDSDSFRYRTVWLRALFADTDKSGEKPRLQSESSNQSRTSPPNNRISPKPQNQRQGRGHKVQASEEEGASIKMYRQNQPLPQTRPGEGDNLYIQNIPRTLQTHNENHVHPRNSPPHDPANRSAPLKPLLATKTVLGSA